MKGSSNTVSKYFDKIKGIRVVFVIRFNLRVVDTEGQNNPLFSQEN